MSTVKAARPITKKSASTRDSKSTADFSGASNSAKFAAGFSASGVQSKPASPSRLGAFYSSAPVMGISPAIQAKFVQQNAEKQTDSTDEIEEAPVQAEAESVQFACAACDAEDSGEPVQAQDDENSETDPVQMWSCDDHEKPTCTLQTKADTNPPLQFACEACESEEEAQPAVQAQNTEEPLTDEDPVQEKCAACESEQAEEANEEPVQEKPSRGQSSKKSKGKVSVLKEANAGLQNAHSPLPHGDTIQAAFGHHDISNIRSEVGGSAGRASQRMGALAYASGDRIGFRHSPNLHLAAHEAAHTVQQRSGLKLPGNVGKPGDQWETHADRVADAVVAGESAEPLLDAVAPVPATANASMPAQPAATASSDGISGAVQHSFTSRAVHQVEPVREEEEASAGGGGAAAEGASAEGGGPSAEEGGEEGAEADAEASPESAEEDPAADCAAAEGGAGEEAAPPAAAGAEAAAPAEAAPAATPEKGRCYNAEASDPPEGSEEPSSDSPPAEVEAEAQVTYGAWEEPNDACECAAAETIPANPAEAAVSEGGEAAPTAETAADAEAEAPAAESSGGGPSRGGGGGGAGGEGESSEGTFGAGEASRDAAVAEFDAATNDVSRVPNRARKLAKGLHFGSTPPGSAEQEANRAMALAQIRSFMQGATEQIDGAVAFVRDELPGRLGSMAEMIKANIAGAMAAEKGAISARIDQARSAAIAEAAAASGAINAEFDASVSLVNGETDAAIQALTDAYITSTDAISGREQTSLTEVNTRFSTGRDDHDAKGTTFANAAVATGQEWVDAYDSCRSGPGNEYQYNGDDGFWDGCLTVRRAKAQQESACKTAGAMGKNMIDMAKQKGFALREQRTQYRCAIIAGAGEAQGTLDSTMEGLIGGLENGRTSTLSGLAAVRDSNLTGVENSLVARFQSLDQQEREQRQAVNDSGYVQQLAVEQMAHQVAAGLVKSVTSAMETLEQTLSSLREQLLAGDAPSPEELSAQLTAAEEGLGEGVGTLLDKMEEGASEAEASMIEAGQTSASALADITSSNASMTAESEGGYSAELSALVAAASDTMAQLTDTHVTNAQESAATGVDGMTQVAAGFVEATERIYGVVDTAIATSLNELDTELTNMAGQLEGKIAGEAWLAASKEQPAWKGVLAVVLIILVIIASIVVTVLTAGAAAAALGPILGAAVLGAVVGAVSAGLIQVINNWAAGDDLTKGLVQAMVMGAVGGAIGGAIGAGANGLAQVGVNAAIRAGSSTLTRAAINVGINLAGDMVAEGATQAFGYFAYGQQFNWQGFVMAGGMSVASTGRGRGGFAGELDTNASLRGLVTRTPRVPGAPRPRLHAPGASEAAIGLGLAGGIEAISFLATGKFDVNRFSTSMASAMGSLAASGGNRPSRTDAPDANPVRPHTEGSAPTAPRPATPEVEAPPTPRPVAPEAEAPPAPRPVVPEAEAPAAPRPAAPEAEAPVTPRPTEADVDGPTTPRPASDAEGAGPRRPGAEEPAPAPSRPHGESEAPVVRPADGDADLARPAKEIPSDELADATTTRQRIGEGEHDFYVDRNGCGVCSACGPTKRTLGRMLEGLPAGPLRTRVEELLVKVNDVEARLAAGESGVRMIQDSADIAASFKAVSREHPSFGRILENPRLTQTETPEGVEVTSPHLRDLDADIVSAHTIDARKFRDVTMNSGDQAIYILRDKGSGAILKVGIAENDLSRVTQYANAGSKLNLDLALDVAIVQPRGGRTIRDIEQSLSARLSDEGHIMPWDNYPSGRLGRSDRGTPFVHPVSKDLMWDAYGNLVSKSTGAPPPPARRGVATPEEVAQMVHDGLSVAEIANLKGVNVSTVYRWKQQWRSEISEALTTLNATSTTVTN